MKALSGYAEWFWLMAKNIKDVENRPKPLPYEMAMNLPIRIYLHASKSNHVQHNMEEIEFILTHLTTEQRMEFLIVDWSKLRGYIIGEITITGQFKYRQYIESDHVDIGSQQRQLQIAKERHEPYMSSWFFGPFGYAVKDGTLYDKPISCKGKLGFFEPEIEVGGQIEKCLPTKRERYRYQPKQNDTNIMQKVEKGRIIPSLSIFPTARV